MRLECLLAFALIACGGNGVHHLADSGIDGANPDAPGSNSSGIVTVEVTSNGAPAAGVQVYFQNADSTLVDDGSAVTDATGKVTAMMAAGGFVTVIEPQNPDAVGENTLDTFAGVKPGDVLHDDVGSPTTTPVQSVVNLTIPTDLAVGVTQYELYASCSGGEIDITPGGSGSGSAAVHRHINVVGANNPPVTFTLNNCTGGLADILIISANNTGAFVDFFYQAGVTVGTATGSGTSVTLTGTYAAVPTITDAVVDAEPTSSAIDGTISIATPRGSVIDNAVDVGPGSDGTLGSAQLLIQMPVIPGGVATTQFNVLPGSGAVDEQIVEDWAPSPAAAVTLDYEASQLKDITAAPTFDVASHSFDWTLGTIGKAPDGLLVELSAQRAGSGGSGSATEWFWRIGAPGTEDGDVALPVLPTGTFDFNIGAGDQVAVTELGGIAVPGGYDAFRGIIFGNAIPAQIMAGSATGTLGAQLFFAAEPGLATPHRDLVSRLWRTTTATR
jgi:hypothetical protein